jgi:hypothetical protein
MVVIKLIFKVVDTFGLMDKDDLETYQAEAKKDWENCPINDSEGIEIKYEGFKKILVMLKKLEKNWLFSVGISIASIFVIRSVSDFLTPDNPIDQFRQDIR